MVFRYTELLSVFGSYICNWRPLFVVDEIMGAYDRTRFKRILEFIKSEVDYLVVTSLVPLEEQQGIQIKHTIDQ